jgi:hypothetical protein
MSDTGGEEIDWSLTTWGGARREQMRRWAALPLENIVAALEEMQEIADWLHPARAKSHTPESTTDALPVEKDTKK